jgi:cell division septation protein DedD
MITIRARVLAAGVLALLLLAGCSREQQDWRAAEGADTLEAYGQFIQRHPDSELVTQARTRIAQLGEDRDWQGAGNRDTAEAYQQFLAQHPNGKWAQEARIRIQNFSLGAAPSSDVPAVAHDAVPAAAAETAAPPVASPVTAAPPAQSASPAATSGVQLGAFTSEEKANTAWRALLGRFGTQLHGLTPHVVAASTASGYLFRLQALGADEARSRAICDELKKQSQGCVPVLPH